MDNHRTSTAFGGLKPENPPWQAVAAGFEHAREALDRARPDALRLCQVYERQGDRAPFARVAQCERLEVAD